MKMLFMELLLKYLSTMVWMQKVFIEHGSIPELYQLCGMDAESIAKQLKKEN